MKARTQQTGTSSYAGEIKLHVCRACAGRGSHHHLPLLLGHWMLSLTLCLSFFSLFKQEHRHSSAYTTTPFLAFLPPSFSLSMFRLIISFLWSPFLCPCLFHFPLQGYSTSRIFTISLRPPDHQQQRHSEQIFIITAVLSPHSKPAVSDAWGVGPSELCFNRPPRGSDACSSLRPLVLEGNVSFTKTCEYL